MEREQGVGGCDKAGETQESESSEASCPLLGEGPKGEEEEGGCMANPPYWDGTLKPG